MFYGYDVEQCYNPRDKKQAVASQAFENITTQPGCSDLSVGLLVHPLYIALLSMVLNRSTDNTVFENTMVAFAVVANFLCYASFFGVMALTADRFLAIHLHLRYHELVTHKRVSAVVLSIMAFSAFIASTRFWVSVRTVRLTIYITIEIFCLLIIAILYYKIYLTVRRHRNQIQSLQVQQNQQNGEDDVAEFRKAYKVGGLHILRLSSVLV